MSKQDQSLRALSGSSSGSNPEEVNYIKHLTAAFEKMAEDTRLNPTHVSLYVSLFLFWNLNWFRNPFSIARGEVMKACKIASNKTYLKCLKDLDTFGYIRYLPSKNPFNGSAVEMCTFYTSSTQALPPSINYINLLNSKHSLYKPPSMSNSVQVNGIVLNPNENEVVKKKEKASILQLNRKSWLSFNPNASQRWRPRSSLTITNPPAGKWAKTNPCKTGRPLPATGF